MKRDDSNFSKNIREGESKYQKMNSNTYQFYSVVSKHIFFFFKKVIVITINKHKIYYVFFKKSRNMFEYQNIFLFYSKRTIYSIYIY